MLQPPLPPPPPFLRPAACRGGGKRAREFETTRTQTVAPTSPPTTSSVAGPNSHNALRCTGTSPSAPPRAGPTSLAPPPENREAPWYGERHHLSLLLFSEVEGVMVVAVVRMMMTMMRIMMRTTAALR